MVGANGLIVAGLSLDKYPETTREEGGSTLLHEVC